MDEHVGAAHQVHDDLPAVQGKNDDKGRIAGKPGGGKGAMVSRVPAFRHDRRHEDMTFPDLPRTLPPLFLKRLPQCLPVLRRKSVIPSCSRMIFSRCSGNIISSRQRHRCLLHVHPNSPIFSDRTGTFFSAEKHKKYFSTVRSIHIFMLFSWRGISPKTQGLCLSFQSVFFVSSFSSISCARACTRSS